MCELYKGSETEKYTVISDLTLYSKNPKIFEEHQSLSHKFSTMDSKVFLLGSLCAVHGAVLSKGVAHCSRVAELVLSC